MAPAKTRQQQPQLYEVLTETNLGHRTVHRVTAASAKAAEDQVRESISDTTKVLESGKAGEGIGSDPGGGAKS